MEKGFSELKVTKRKEKKRARGSSSTAEEDVSEEMILEKLTKIHEDIKTLKEELKGEIQSVKSELSEATKSLGAVGKEVQSPKQKNKDLQDQCDSTTRENNKLNEVSALLKIV